ncbi:type II secretion system protein [Spirillospora sp. CA-253888]
MLEPLRRRRADHDQGFTLIELLVVVVIIGVLVGIALPLYLNYRKGASNKSAESDVRSAVTAVEQYFTDNGNTYPAGTLTAENPKNLEFAAAEGGTKQTATISPGNTLAYALKSDAGGAPYYVLCGQNKDGKDVYVYNGSKGGSVAKSSAATAQACASGAA